VMNCRMRTPESSASQFIIVTTGKTAGWGLSRSLSFDFPLLVHVNATNSPTTGSRMIVLGGKFGSVSSSGAITINSMS
jgi:hypothetical protein